MTRWAAALAVLGCGTPGPAVVWDPPAADDPPAPVGASGATAEETSPWRSCDLPSAIPDGVGAHNVLVVLLDDVGVDKVGAYGIHPDPPYTPTLDSLADEGVRFDRAYATPLCGPTRAALLTGRTGRRTGFGNNVLWYSGDFALPATETTFAELVAESEIATWSTAAFGKWHLADADTPDVLTHPNLHGFEHFDGTVANLTSAFDISDGLPHDYYHWERNVDGQVEHVDGWQPTVMTDDALDWIDGLREPWVVYFAMHVAHGPLQLPPEDLHGLAVDADDPAPLQFAALMEAGDAELGRLLANLPDGALERTTVVVLSDNGTKGSNMAAPWNPARGKGSIYEGGIRVPLIVTGPLVAQPGSTSDALVYVTDVFPTIADIACVDPAALESPRGTPLAIDGLSLVPWLRDPDAPGRDFLFVEQFGRPGPPPYNGLDKRIMVGSNWKLVDDVGAGMEMLLTIADDPSLEGEDTLADGLTATEQFAYDELRAALDAHMPGLIYEGPE